MFYIYNFFFFFFLIGKLLKQPMRHEFINSSSMPLLREEEVPFELEVISLIPFVYENVSSHCDSLNNVS